MLSFVVVLGSSLLVLIARAQDVTTQQTNTTNDVIEAPCVGPFNTTFGAAHVVFQSTVRGGYNALGFEFARFNTTHLWLGSIETGSLSRLDLLTNETKVVRTITGGVSAIHWRSRTARSSYNDEAELLLGSASVAVVRGVKKLNRTGQVDKVFTDQQGNWPAKPLPGVRSFAVESSSGKVFAVTCVKDGGEDALWVWDEWRGQFCKVAEGYGCLGHAVVFAKDDTLFAVSMDKRQVLRLWSGFPTVVANFSQDVVPTAVGLDSEGRLFVGANRVNRNQREAEVYVVDIESGETQLVAAVGGAVLDTLLVTPDNRVFFTDPAHDAVHEVVFNDIFLANELALIRNGNLVSGGRHPGAASSTARKYGHAAFRTIMLVGEEDLATGGGAAAWTTPDGTDIVLLADTYQLKSLTADRFIDSWPLPIAPTLPTRIINARNVYVAPTRAFAEHEPNAVVASDWARGEVHLLSAFAPHDGDFVTDALITETLEAPYGVAITRDSTVLVADFATGSVTAHAPGANAPTVIAGQLDGPTGLAIAQSDENATYIYVTEYKAGRVVRITRDSGDRLVLATGLAQPEGIAVSPLDGRLTVIESAGERRLLSISAAVADDVRVLASLLPSAGDSTASHPGTLAAVSWTQSRVVTADAEIELGARSTATLYVVLDGNVRRYQATLRADDDVYHKPTDAELFATQTIGAKDDKGRAVVNIPLFGTALPAPFAVPEGTWLRFRAFRQDEVHAGQHAPSNTRLLVSDIPGFVATRLYPAAVGTHTVTGQSELLVQLTKRGTYYVRDQQYANSSTTITVYDAAYDDESSYKYCPTAQLAPEPTPAPVLPCRKEIECALGYRGNGTKDERDCYVGTLTCLPVAQTILVWNDRNGGAVHGGNGPYVPPKFHPSDPIEKPSFPGSIYQWSKWREWWQTARPGNCDASQYWYAPQRKQW